MKNILLIIGAIVHLFFALVHVSLWQAVSAPGPLSSLDEGSRAMFLTLNMAVAVTCLIFAYLSLFHRGELLSTRLGSGVLAAIGAFWIMRGIAQLIFYGTLGVATAIGVGIWWLISLLYFIPVLGSRRAPVPASPG